MNKVFYFAVCLLLLSSQSIFAQKANLSGKVTDKNKETLIGAIVRISGTNHGAVTNENGEYTLNSISNGKHEIVVSYVGYHRQKREITFTGQNQTLNIELQKSSKLLNEVVVTGTGTATHKRRSPVKTDVISSKQIKSIASPSLEGTLAAISPSFDFSPSTMGSFMKLNGLSNKYILVLVDGKRLYGDIGGNTDLSRINPSNIERIEVVKGASSSLYGSEAMGGVINIITKNSRDKIYIENSSQMTKFNQLQYRNVIGLNFGKFSSKTIFNHKKSDGWQNNPNEITISRKTKEISDTVATDAMTTNKFRDKEFRQDLNFNVTKRLSVHGLFSIYNKEVFFPESEKKYGYVHDNKGYAFGGKYRFGKRDYITLDYNSDEYEYSYKYAYDNFNSKTKERLNSAGDELLQKIQKRDDINLKTVFTIAKRHRVSIGTEFVNEELESAGRLKNGENVEAYTLSAFAQDEYKVMKNFILYAGFRYTQHKEFGNSFTPKISALYKLGNFNFRAAFAKGFKAPTLKELYYNYQKRSYLYIGNEDLKPQKNDYYSFTAEYNSKRFSLSVSPYLNKLTDMIDYRIIETTPENKALKVKTTKEHYNIGEAEIKGVDLTFNVKLDYGFSFGGGYSYVDAQNEIEDIRLEGVAYNYVTTRLAWEKSWADYTLNATLSGRIQDEKFYNDAKGNSEAYNLWKFTTVHRIANFSHFDLEATVGIDNVFDYVDDRPYGYHIGTLTPGRTLFVGVNIKFGV